RPRPPPRDPAPPRSPARVRRAPARDGGRQPDPRLLQRRGRPLRSGRSRARRRGGAREARRGRRPPRPGRRVDPPGRRRLRAGRRGDLGRGGDPPPPAGPREAPRADRRAALGRYAQGRGGARGARRRSRPDQRRLGARRSGSRRRGRRGRLPDRPDAQPRTARDDAEGHPLPRRRRRGEGRAARRARARRGGGDRPRADDRRPRDRLRQEPRAQPPADRPARSARRSRPADPPRREPQELPRRPDRRAARRAVGRKPRGGRLGRPFGRGHPPRARRPGDRVVPPRLDGDPRGRRLNWPRFLQLLTWRDPIDILAVAVVVYNLLLLIRGTRAVQMLLGIVFVGFVYYAARLADLPTLQTLLESLLIVLPFAVIILFQQEIRRALANFGRNPLWGLARQQKVASTFNEVVLAATTLAARRIGALIVIERLQGLRNYIENGVRID